MMKKKFISQLNLFGVEIVITEEAAIATIFEDETGEVISHGTSRRDPIDKFDYDVASGLAVGRAYARLSKKLLKQANGKVACNDFNAIQSKNKTPKPADLNAVESVKVKGKKKGKKKSKSSNGA